MTMQGKGGLPLGLLGGMPGVVLAGRGGAPSDSGVHPDGSFKIAADLGWDYSKEQLSCANMQRFTLASSASYNIYWEKNWSVGGENQCQLVSYQTPYSALIAGNYVKCVEANWNVKLQ